MKTLAFTLLLSLFALSAEACPIFNGKFVKTERISESSTSSVSLKLTTAVIGDEYRYGISDMVPVLANGLPVRLEEDGMVAQLKVSCGDERVRFELDMSTEGRAELVLTRVDENTVQASATGYLGPITGTYRKE